MSSFKSTRSNKVPTWRWILLAVLGCAPAASLLLFKAEEAETKATAERALAPLDQTNPAEMPPSEPIIADRALLGTRAPAQVGDVIVSTGKALVAGLATDGSRVYFAESLLGNRILSVPVNGGAESSFGSGRFPIDVTLGKGALVVADVGALMSDGQGTVTVFPLDGSASHIAGSKIVMPAAIAVDATHVYWVDSGSVERDYADGFVGRAPVAGGSSQILAAGEREPGAVAVDATHVYWARHAKGGLGEIVRMPIAGGKIETVSPGQNRVKRMMVRGDEIYWISSRDLTGTGAVVRRAKITGGPAVDVVEAEHRMCSMTIDDEAVYWSDPGEVSGTEASTTGRILKKPLSGAKEPIELAKGQDRPCYVAVDATHVYFSTQSFERIKKTPKNPAK